MRKKLLKTIQGIMKEKYIVGKATIIEDLRNSVDILCDELRLLYEAGGCLQGSMENIDCIITRNEESLCEICCKKENDKYMTLKNIYNTAFGELHNKITDKELEIYIILSSMIFSKINELEDLIDFDMEDIEDIEIDTVIDVVTNAIERLVDEFVEIDEKINYFDNLICYISEELEEQI